MAEIWGAAIAGVAIAGASVYNAQSNKPSAPPPRSLNGEITGINGQYGDTLNNYLSGSGTFTGDSLGNLQTLARGQFDANKFFSQNPEAKAGWDAHWTNGENAGWTPEQFAQAFMGGADHLDQNQFNSYLTGGLPGLSSQINTGSRTANLADAQALGGQYTSLTRGANQNYYNALDAYTNATQQPVGQSIPQQQAAQQAAQGYGSFNPSGLQANTAFFAPQVNASQGSPLLTQLNQQAMNQGPSGLQQQQNTLASQLLSQGGQLSASDLRNVQQSSRAGFAARGLDATNASVVDETMQTDAAQRARLIQNLGIAQGVQNQGLSEQNLQNQFGLGVSNQNYGYGQLGLQGQIANQNAGMQSNQLGLQGQIANQNFGLNAFNSNLSSQTAQQQALQQSAALLEQQRQAQLAAQGNAVQLQRQGFLDPFAAITGSADQNLFGQVLGQNNANMGTQSSLYGGLLGYGGDLNNTNYNASAAAGIAGYNGQQAMYGSLIQAGGQIGSAYLANKGK